MPEALTEAITRGWLRLVAEARRAIHPNSALTQRGVVNSRLLRAYLTPRVRGKHPELGPVLRAKSPERRELDQVAEAVAGLLPEVLADGPVATGLREAFARAGIPVAEHEDKLYGWVVRWDGGRPPSAEECDQVILEHFGRDPDAPPPNYSLLKALLADERAVQELSDMLDRHWNSRAAEPRCAPDRAEQQALEDLLDSDVTSDMEKLWGAYVDQAPWERLLGDAAAAGLSASSVPPKPTVNGRRTGQKTPFPLPLDRSLRQRLSSAVFEKPEKASAAFRDSTTRDVARQEAERMCRPLGLVSGELRAAFVLGVQLAYAVNRSMFEERRSPGGRKPVQRLHRRTEKLIAQVFRDDFFAYSERRSGGLSSFSRRRLDDPQFHVVPRLWPRLHTRDVRGESSSPEGWFPLLYSAIRSFIRESGEQAASADDPRVVPLGGRDVSAPEADLSAPDSAPVSFMDIGVVVASVFNHHIAQNEYAGHSDAFQLTRWFLTASDQEAVHTWWSEALNAYAASLPDGEALPVRPTAAEAQEIIQRLHAEGDDSGEGR
ncbi:hypothetical protein [Streptomyces sp. NPDC002328]|uniref:hypothetical protein n=1 Tax=Streptomyces sp. NPDC002328 TaxID=3364642 RepID=UPI0036CCB96E